MDSPKYASFNISSTVYKTVNRQEIPVWVFLPKTIPNRKAPLLIHFHGGFLIAGHALYPEWHAQWAVDYAIKYSAIMIAPNYRLMPESTGLEILSDIQDFWTWMQNDLTLYLKGIGSDVIPDYEKVLAHGESAGGYLAIQSALTRPDFIKAVIAAYPMIFVDSPWYTVPWNPNPQTGAPLVPKKVLDDHITAMPKDKIFTGVFPPDRMVLVLAALHSGEISGLIGTDDALFPAKLLEKAKDGQRMPFLFLLHGIEDNLVPCAETKQFLSLRTKKFGENSAVGKFVTGDHGMDVECTLETSWLNEGLIGTTEAWAVRCLD
ncbi:Non-reducing polyketide synthase [Hyphodiscus hymeniophilus]|uniref:Non-reducing polyketide synthase n=1 Tax=Hyphodiscus hymeniophilus TaxID=353542 RepID=A0A9P6VLJ8_9HELO|nr:Non-reducing polyketide synthase [Hyphodiscus hymeniophilus]